MNLDFSQIVPSIPFMIKGIWVTLQIVSVSLIIGFILGTILSIFKISKFTVLRLFADAYTSLFRGTPLILQLFLFYYATPQLTGIMITAYAASVLTFGLNSAAYVSEIIRAGIQAVDKGQQEAAEALGVPYRQILLNIILPQAIKNILPALMNEFITLTKESAIVATIGVLDVMRRAQIVTAEKYIAFEPLMFAALMYYILVMGLTLLGRILERRLRRSD
ncbi:amino acid ABC transporter permease [Anaerobacillus isosaccharinicus]|uniref:Amino acid ABC transporter permease n=1 Tax=Anaerobacillus isosaccharinicus TaxID=1532552 RepID=A0A1S2MDU7_9BACI|nr:amino acid ABC transporter permease [Anaerobacillus isosaccharinicus]MBA5585661.1 amino acid ABC transporter permease [Anaerobacillus isosaccharinicus]QOY36031.1 amino acid ABC transporter permease [Anaerobacillus isosaccharinicus]